VVSDMGVLQNRRGSDKPRARTVATGGYVYSIRIDTYLSTFGFGHGQALHEGVTLTRQGAALRSWSRQSHFRRPPYHHLALPYNFRGGDPVQ
jgi:hypothetical protein